jgi:hypothetical protein
MPSYLNLFKLRTRIVLSVTWCPSLEYSLGSLIHLVLSQLCQVNIFLNLDRNQGIQKGHSQPLHTYTLCPVLFHTSSPDEMPNSDITWIASAGKTSKQKSREHL